MNLKDLWRAVEQQHGHVSVVIDPEGMGWRARVIKEAGMVGQASATMLPAAVINALTASIQRVYKKGDTV